MATFNKFNQFVADVANKVHNLGTDSLKLLLTNTAPVASNTVKANITEIAAAGGYPAGGVALTVTGSTQTAGLYKLVVNDATLTAVGASIGPFRYIVLYNSTPGAGPLIGWYDYGSALTLAVGESILVDADQVNGILQLQ